jgi:NADPH2:quinone reductase
VKAVHAVAASPDNQLVGVDLDEPRTTGLVSIRVEAAGVTQPDLLQISGRYQTARPLPFVPGAEAVGTVTAAPEGAEGLIGRRVVAITPEGAWQEQVAVPAHQVFAVPGDVSADRAAGLLVNYVAAYFGLVTRGAARSGETLVVHGAAGGIGGAAVQIGTALGLRTIAVVSTPAKAEYATSLGATDAVLADSWKARVDELVGPSGIDAVFDPVAGDRFDDSLRILRPGGRLLVIGFLGGHIPEVKVNRLLLRNISLVGVATGAYMQQHPSELGTAWNALSDLIDRGRLELPAATTFPMSQVDEAVAAVRERRAVGKVAIVIQPDHE